MLHDNLKKLRKEKGFSQGELANRLNVVRQTISKWEKGLSVPDAATLIKIADILGVPANELLEIDPVSEVVTENIDEQLSQIADFQKNLEFQRGQSLRIIFKRFLLYESAEMQHYLEQMTKRGYRLMNIWNDFMIFVKDERNFQYYVLRADEAHSEAVHASLTLDNWHLIGKNSVFAVYISAVHTSTPAVDTPKPLPGVLSTLVSEFWAIMITFLTFAILFGYSTTKGTPMSPPIHYLYLLTNFVTGISIFYYLTELYNLARIRPATGRRVRSANFLYALGNIAILASMVCLIALLLFAMAHGSLDAELLIALLCVAWPLTNKYSRSQTESFIRATASMAEIAYMMIYLSYYLI